MDQLQQRLEALEQRTHTIVRQLRWWRGLACALVGLGVLTWALPSGTAQETLEQRVAALEAKLVKLTFEAASNTLILTGANLRLVNGLGRTTCADEAGQPIPNCPNGLGNLIVGYNEPRPEGSENIRTGSHNVVVGMRHNFSRFGGLVVGNTNEISGDFAAVSGGRFNTASGAGAAVSGGVRNQASSFGAAVSGGTDSAAFGPGAAVSGGTFNRASGDTSSISGGEGNQARERASSVSGGHLNQARGMASAVSGGQGRTAAGDLDWVAGDLFQDR